MKLRIAMLAMFALLIGFLSLVATRIEKGVEAEYSHLPKPSDYAADYTASVKNAKKLPTDISAKRK